MNLAKQKELSWAEKSPFGSDGFSSRVNTEELSQTGKWHVLRQSFCRVPVSLSVAGFFKDAFGDAYSEFMKAASNLRESYRFAHTSEEELIQKYEADGE